MTEFVMKNHPFYEVATSAEKKMLQGHLIFQKFTCEHCGVRQTMDEPNKFFKTGRCEECQGTTNIEKNGCNFMVITNMTVEQWNRTK